MIGIDSDNVHVSSGLYRIEPGGDGMSEISFSSPYTCALVAARFWKQMAQQGHGSDRRYTKWFELLCTLVLCAGGDFQARSLQSKSADEITATLQLPESSLLFMSAPTVDANVGAMDDSEQKGSKPNANDEFYKRWASNESPGGGNYILTPRTTNLPVVDCVSLPHPETGPRGFQVTVSSTHPISYGESEKILAALGKDFDLYFVVPDHVAADFKRQIFKDGTSKSSLHEHVNQHVIGISIEHIQDFSKLYEECIDDKLAEFIQNTMYNNTLKRLNSNTSLAEPPSKRADNE